jgi:hypothetical protein
VIDRAFAASPPACLAARAPFAFRCTPDAERPGYCRETFGQLGLAGAGAIADPAICLDQVAKWVAAERAAEGAGK